MDKTDLILKYARMLCDLEYPVGDEARFFLKMDGRIYATENGLDFRCGAADIRDITEESSLEKDVLNDLSGRTALVLAKTPYLGICIDSGHEIRACLDDMAQIVGYRVGLVPHTYKDVHRALSRGEAVMVRGRYAILAGRSLYEACVALTVLEKSAEITLKSAVIGGAKPLSRADSLLMREVYKRKYSKAEADFHAQEESEEQSPAVSEIRAGKALSVEEAREQLVTAGLKLQEQGLVQGTWGNLSVRLNQEQMLCTPSGIDYSRLTPEDMVVVNIADNSWEGERKPTSERGLHAGIYAARPEVGAVIHTHSAAASIFAAANMPVAVEDPQMAACIGDVIPVAKYGLPGTKKLSENTRKALGKGTGCIMAHHGMICCGEDLFDTFQKCGMIEEAARQYIDRRWEERI